ncbi:MAG: ABC transporter permease subunit [Halovenus sp.]
MSTLAVAKKDFRDALRSRALWAISIIFIFLSLIIAYAFAEFPAELGLDEQTAKGLAYFLASQISLFVSITAIVIAYKAIAGERESGSIKILLALPHTRGDVVLGKVLGRSATLAVPTVIALLAGAALGSALLGLFDPLVVALLLVVSVLFVLTYVSVMVALSALSSSTTRASALTIGFFFVFELLWNAIALGIVWLSKGFTLPQTAAEYPDWMFVVNQVPPSSAFVAGLNAVIPGEVGSINEGGQQAADIDAVYATPWLGIVMLAVWLVVPLAIGYWRFSKADL